MRGNLEGNYEASILIHGDDHLSSRNYGGHVDYPGESLECFQTITKIMEDEKVTHLISPGDLTYGRFNLAYRTLVEDELNKRNQMTNGNVFQLRGNHDYSTSGMTEWEYYTTHRKLMKPATRLEFSSCVIHMIDFGKENVPLELSDTKENIVVGHNYFNFKDSPLPNFGSPIILDDREDWFNVSMVISGHIHKNFHLAGKIVKDGISRDVGLYYPGSLSRPEFTEGLTNEGEVCILRIGETISFDFITVSLKPVEEAFAIADTIKEFKRVDISDIIKNLNNKERNIGSPEQIIDTMTDFKQEYRRKAKELLGG